MRKEDCTGLGSITADFPQSSWHGGVFWICHQKRVVQIENKGILYLFLQNFRTSDTEIIPF